MAIGTDEITLLYFLSQSVNAVLVARDSELFATWFSMIEVELPRMTCETTVHAAISGFLNEYCSRSLPPNSNFVNHFVRRERIELPLSEDI